jgi:hypothetical protein
MAGFSLTRMSGRRSGRLAWCGLFLNSGLVVRQENNCQSQRRIWPVRGSAAEAAAFHGYLLLQVLYLFVARF